MKLLLLCGLVLTGVVGCTHLSVRRIDPAAPHAKGPVGERAALPLPGFLVTPKANGTLDIEKMALPDPDNTFAIDGWSFLAAHTLKVKTDSGILTEVTWNPQSDAIVAGAVKAAGSIAAEKEKADQAEDKQDAADAKAKADAAAAAKKAHDKAVSEAELDVKQKLVALQAAKASKDDAAISAAQVAYDQAVLKLEWLRNQPPSAYNAPSPAFNEPGNRAHQGAGWIPGPIVFVLEDFIDKDGREIVRLVPAAQQQRASGSCDVSDEVSLRPPRPVPPSDIVAEAVVPCAVDKVNEFDLMDPSGKSHKADVHYVSVRSNDPRVLDIALRSGIESGPYVLQINIQMGDLQRTLNVEMLIQ